MSRGDTYGVDGAGPIRCVLCDATSATVEAHNRHMEAVHDC
jgi:hypothetical protein